MTEKEKNITRMEPFKDESLMFPVTKRRCGGTLKDRIKKLEPAIFCEMLLQQMTLEMSKLDIELIGTSAVTGPKNEAIETTGTEDK